MKRVIITGATGFVGANLARRLLDDGHRVHLLVRPGHTAWRLDTIRTDVAIYEVELDDTAGLASVVAEIRPEWIFHLATHGAYSWQNDARRIVTTNILGTINLVEACLRTGFEAFVNTGSSSEYGAKSHAPAEDSWLEPNSVYAVAKASATLYCRHIARSAGVHMPTLRLYSVYGPYEEPNRLMPTLIIHGLRGVLPPLVNPDIARDYVYSVDVSEAFIRAATTPGQEPGAVYNVGSGQQTTLREVVDLARRELQIASEPDWGSMANRSWDTTTWVADNHAIRHELDWQPRHSFAEGFRKMVAWFRDNPALLERYDNILLR